MQLAKQTECPAFRIAANPKGKPSPSRTAGMEFLQDFEHTYPVNNVGITSGSWLWSPKAVASWAGWYLLVPLLVL